MTYRRNATGGFHGGASPRSIRFNADTPPSPLIRRWRRARRTILMRTSRT
jgi:hypothetical protein